MKKAHLQYVACPGCLGDLEFHDVQNEHGDEVETGSLHCRACGRNYDVVRSIPRFVPMDNYASGFGLEWTKHARTQYDSDSGAAVSEERFFRQTRWPRRLDGQLILEVGGGSGRFTEQAASTGAMVVSIDLSHAVDANYASNGGRENVLIVQGDLYRMPVRERFFDKLFCFGVLQHTPDPARAFAGLPRYLKPGGSLAIDVYRQWGWLKQLTMTKYWVRPLTTRMAPETLYHWCRRYVAAMWPVTKLLVKVPVIGRPLTWRLLVADYRGVYDVPDAALKEWAVLDTFDMLSPAYDFPQAVDTVHEWFRNARVKHVEVRCGHGIIEGRGTVS